MTLARNLADLGSQVDSSGTLGVSGGGTGQTNTTNAFDSLAPSQTGNSGKYLTTDGTNSSWGSLPPTITSVSPSSFDGNAGQSFSVIGNNFSTGCSTVFIGYDGVTTYATTTTRNSSTSLTVVNGVDMPVSNESYSLKVINSDGSYAIYSGIDAGSAPTWTTASGSLGSVTEGNSANFTVVATDSDGSAITYTSTDIGSGSLSWASLNSSTGVISGTAPTVSEDTVYSFSVTATDNAGNATSRSFSLTVSNNTVVSNIEYLVIAGGGGGGKGNNSGGGGGAGGYRSSVIGESSGGGASAESVLSLSLGVQYTVTVGNGGNGSSNSSINGSNGGNSVFASITAIGGGGGGSGGGGSNSTGNSGGSGGGGGTVGNSVTYSGGSGTSNQGFGGGSGLHVPEQYEGGGGGGGAGSAGDNSSGGQGGNGGSALSSSITGSSVARAGGGGAYGNSIGVGGGGGAGNGGGNSAQANTGSGGGGAYSGTAGSGGSGFVAIRYPDSQAAATSTTGSPTYTVSGGYRIYTWTQSGSITF